MPTQPKRPTLPLSQDTGGAAALIVGIMIPVLFICAGVAIDVARMHAVYARAQSGLDAALLGAAATAESTEAIAEAGRLFDANFAPGYMGTTRTEFTITKPPGTSAVGEYTGSATFTLPNTLMRIAGFDNSTIRVESNTRRGYVTSPETILELSLALDSTASMNCPSDTPVPNGQCRSFTSGRKIDALRTAVSDLLDIIYGQEASLPNVFVSVIPYTTAVSLVNVAGTEDWAKTAYTGLYSGASGVSFQTVNGIAPGNLQNIEGNYRNNGTPRVYPYLFAPPRGHLSNRRPDVHVAGDPEASNTEEYLDNPPTNEATRFRTPRGKLLNLDPTASPCFFYPNTTANYVTGAYNPSLPATPLDGSCKIDSYPSGGTRTQLDLSVAPIFGATLATDYSELSSILFARNDKQSVINMVNGIYPTGYTRVNIGLMWGWYTLSPKWEGNDGWGVSGVPVDPNSIQPHQRLIKAMVLMTDGENTVFLGNPNDPNDETFIANDDNSTLILCNNVRSAGVKLYVVAFGPQNEINEPLMQQCATGGGAPAGRYFYAPDAAALRTAFQQIARSVVQFTIKLTK